MRGPTQENLKSFLNASRNSAKDIIAPTKTIVFGVFDFHAFLNMAMLLFVFSRKIDHLRQSIFKALFSYCALCCMMTFICNFKGSHAGLCINLCGIQLFMT